MKTLATPLDNIIWETDATPPLQRGLGDFRCLILILGVLGFEALNLIAWCLVAWSGFLSLGFEKLAHKNDKYVYICSLPNNEIVKNYLEQTEKLLLWLKKIL